MKLLITGGCKNGKSTYALRRAGELAQGAQKYYVATMLAFHEEDLQRIRYHREMRAGLGFTTVEKPFRLEEVFRETGEKGVFVLDSLTALLINEMYAGRSDGEPDPGAEERTAAEVIRFLQRAEHAIVVSDSITAGGELPDAYSQAFLKALGRLEQRIAAECDETAEVCCGIPRIDRVPKH